MKTPLLVILSAIALLVVSTLAMMNNACKSTSHQWCSPMSSIRHHPRS